MRFYDEVGLLKPTFVDGATGYRYYSANLLPRLNRILVFKELGFSLDEIAPLLEGELPVSEVQEMLRVKRAELKDNIDREQARLAQVEMWLGKMEQESRVPDYEIALRQVAPQLVAAVRKSLASYDEAAELFTELNRHLKNYNAHGQHAAVWHTCSGQAERIDCEAVVFLNRPVPDSKRIAVYVISKEIRYEPYRDIKESNCHFTAAVCWLKRRLDSETKGEKNYVRTNSKCSLHQSRAAGLFAGSRGARRTHALHRRATRARQRRKADWARRFSRTGETGL
jgi:DNA-binding transcriptional MerR regulator